MHAIRRKSLRGSGGIFNHKFRRFRILRAGTPAQTSPGGTSRSTTDPMPMTAPAPMSTISRTNEPCPKYAHSPTVTGPWIDSGGISPTLANTFFMHVAHVIAGRDLGGPLRLKAASSESAIREEVRLATKGNFQLRVADASRDQARRLSGDCSHEFPICGVSTMKWTDRIGRRLILTHLSRSSVFATGWYPRKRNNYIFVSERSLLRWHVAGYQGRDSAGGLHCEGDVAANSCRQ
jgi:hypothetical protein